jgi:hypothetical protein
MDFASFRKEYSRQFAGMANRIWSGWRLPAAVSREDVEQEMWANAWLAWNNWQPGRGEMERHVYAVVTAKQAAVRWVHVQRNSLRRSDTAPGRFAEGHEQIDELQCMQSTQELALVFEQSLRATLRACNELEREAVRALVRHAFDVDAAATAMASVAFPRIKARALVGKMARTVETAVSA